MAKVISQLPSGGSVPKHNNLLGLNEGDYLHLTQFEKAKLDGIQSGAEVNVNADWNAISGDAQILNKPVSFPPSTHTHTISEVINLQNELNSKENISNKVNTISGNSSTEYPTEKAVVDYVSSQIGADFAKVVYFDNVTPNVASIFDLNNPPLVNDPSLKEDVANLYIGTDASTWVYITSPAGYVTKTVTSSGSNFYITGTSTDAGSIKTGSITKKGQIVIDSEVVNDSGLTLKKTESSILKTDSLGKVVKATNLQDVEYAPIVHTHTVSQITDFPTFKTIENQSIIGAGNIDLDKNSVGLGNVDNTSDLSKPLSTATQTALNGKENSFTKNTAFNKNFGTTAGTVVEGGTLGSNAYNSTAYLPLTGGTLSGYLNLNDGIGLVLGSESTSRLRFITFNGINYIQSGAGSEYGTRADLVITGNYGGNETVRFKDNGRVLINKTDDDLTNQLQVAGTISASPATTANQVPTWGQVQAAAARPYKVYTALLSQTGTNTPTATVLENTLGGTVVWSRLSDGIYNGTLAGVFTANKTWTSITSTATGKVTGAVSISVDAVMVATSSLDSALSDSAIEIRVYN